MISILGGSIIALCWGSAAVCEQYISRSNTAFGTVLVTRAIVTLCTAIPLALLVSLLFRQGILARTPATWTWSIASQLCTVAGAALNLWLLRTYPVSIIITIAGLYPIATTLISALIGNEKISVQQWIGLSIISVGLILFFTGAYGKK